MRLSYTSYRLKCTLPFGIARSTYNFLDRVLIYLEQDGFLGSGEAATSDRYNGSVTQLFAQFTNKIIYPKSVSSTHKLL